MVKKKIIVEENKEEEKQEDIENKEVVEDSDNNEEEKELKIEEEIETEDDKVKEVKTKDNKVKEVKTKDDKNKKGKGSDRTEIIKDKLKKEPEKKKTIVKEPTKEKPFSIPAEIVKLLKPIKEKYYKDISDAEFNTIYKDEFDELKEEYKDQKWKDIIFHRKAFTSIKNKKKRESLGGALEHFIAVPLGVSKIKDLSEKRRKEILSLWADDPLKAVEDKLLLTRKVKNPETGEINNIPIQNGDGEVIPVDNREFFKRKDGSSWKNPNHNKALPHSYRKNVIGTIINKKKQIGVFVLELSDKQTELEVPINVPVKTNVRVVSVEEIKMTENNFVTDDLVNSLVESINNDIESKIINEEYGNLKIEELNKLLIKIEKKEEEEEEEEPEKNEEEKLSDKKEDKKGFSDEEEVEEEVIDKIFLFKLRSSKSTNFIVIEDEEEIEELGFPLKVYDEDNINLKEKCGLIDIDLLYHKYFKPFMCDPAHLLEYHSANRYIDEDPEKTNWTEFCALLNLNLLQENMEMSMAGNITMYVDDDSLLINSVVHNEKTIDSIRLLVPSHIKTDFGVDSKVNIIGTPFQFQAQDDNKNPIYEDGVDDDGNEIKIPVYDYPIIMVFGIYPIPEYKVEIEEIDMGESEEEGVESLENPEELDESNLIDMDTVVEKKKTPKKELDKQKKQKKKEEVEEEVEDITEEENEEEPSEKENEKIEEKPKTPIKPKVDKKKEPVKKKGKTEEKEKDEEKEEHEDEDLEEESEDKKGLKDIW